LFRLISSNGQLTKHSSKGTLIFLEYSLLKKVLSKHMPSM